MDFSTVDRKVDSALYKTMKGPPLSVFSSPPLPFPDWSCLPSSLTTEFIDDVKLVFSNCRTFNQADTPVVLSANILEKAFDEKMQKADKEMV